MKILSLFDGCSGLQQAISNLGWKYEYFASEIDKYSQAVTKYNFPGTHFIGDVTKVNGADFKDVFLLSAGFPCQDLSIAGKRAGLKGKRSGLFWELVRILKECKPKYFLIENVASMSDLDYEIISDALGVYPIMIDSALLSCQTRKRYYWTNIKLGKPEFDIFGFNLPKTTIKQPKHTEEYLIDILESGYTEDLKSFTLTKTYPNTIESDYLIKKNRQMVLGNVNPSGRGINGKIYDSDYKSPTLTTNKGEGIKVAINQRPRGKNKGGLKAQDGKLPTISSNDWPNNNHLVFSKPLLAGKDETIKGHDYNKRIYDPAAKIISISTCTNGGHVPKIAIIKGKYRKLTPIEVERAFGIKDNYTQYGIFGDETKKISPTQRYKMCGNGFSIEAIMYLLKQI